jgi:hypothetical protein
MAEQPDFENMTPEEMMAWMETLAKRQGATEGFTTEADLEIPEVDPETAVIDEPGYVPYSETRAGRPADEPPARPAPPAIPPARVEPATPPVAQPSFAPQPTRPQPPAATPPAPMPPPAARPPTPSWTRAAEPPAAAPPPKPQAEPQGSLAWLESLAQQNDDSLFNLDLSGLGEESAAPAAPAMDPGQWLESLAAAPDPGRISGADVSEETDSLRWLESLARRQGAPADELTTAADFNLSPLKGEPEAPAYKPFSFETTPAPRTTGARASEDPAAFLGSLAASEGYSEGGVVATREKQPDAVPPAPAQADDDIEEIKRSINEGRATSEQIQALFEHQMDVAEGLPPGPDELMLDEDVPPVPAELPDWLLEQVQVDEAPPPPPPRDVPPLESLFDRLEPDIPDWLRDQDAAERDDLADIFAPDDELQPAPQVEVDPNDPWVEALDREHTEGVASVEEPPPWYLRNVSDPSRLAALDDAAAASGLSDEPLPQERELPAGEAQVVPDFMRAEQTAAEPEEPADDIPEWLHEMENIVMSSEIPAWLNEPVEFIEDEGLPFELEDAPATPEFVIDRASEQAAPPAEPSAALESARQRRQSGDTAGALEAYEALIRGGVQLQACVDDLAHVAKVERDNPVVFRVLGDGYMRLGKLQLALDTYREALNHL